MKEALAGVVEKFPALQGPAYFAYNGSRTIRNISVRFAIDVFGYMPTYMSDRQQDRWVIEEVYKGKKGGFFVELGAADGLFDSNTYILEKRYGWRGLLIEPNPVNFAKIAGPHKRTSTAVPLAVDPEPGVLEFLIDGQRSSLLVEEVDNLTERRADKLKRFRDAGKVIEVESVPLEEVFARYDAPADIDFFSLDVEGSETRILRNFPFDRYRFLAMTIERPTPELNEILFANGYHFVKNSLYDTFYVHESNPNFADIRKLPFEQLPPKLF